jgi:hypothetical protein
MGLFHKKVNNLPTIKEETPENSCKKKDDKIEELEKDLQKANEQIIRLFDEILQLKSKNLRLELENYNISNSLRDIQNDLEISNINYYNEVNTNRELKIDIEFYKREIQMLKEITDIYEEYNKELIEDLKNISDKI